MTIFPARQPLKIWPGFIIRLTFRDGWGFLNARRNQKDQKQNMSEFQIQKATRRGVIPLIGLYGESGCGKTMSALLLARGLVGPSGDIHLIDTESRRGSLYADVIPGGYSVLDLDAPFTPDRYVAAMDAVFRAKATVLVIDSMSHEWEGQGGVLDLAAENEEKSGKSGLHNWKLPKFSHGKLVQFLLRSPIPVVCCIRAKYKTRQEKENGKTIIVKDKVTSPIQAEDFIFEMTAHAEVLPDHSINLTKCSHPRLRDCFPAKGPIETKHGEAIAKWCAAGGVSTPAQPAISPEIKKIKGKLWALTDKIHLGKVEALEQYLWDENLLDPTKALADLGESELRAVYAATESKIREGEGVMP